MAENVRFYSKGRNSNIGNTGPVLDRNTVRKTPYPVAPWPTSRALVSK